MRTLVGVTTQTQNAALRWAESPIVIAAFSELSTLAGHFAVPRGTNVARMNANRAI